VLVGKPASGKTVISQRVIDRNNKNKIHITNVNNFIKQGGCINELMGILNKGLVDWVFIEAIDFREIASVHDDLIENKFVFISM